MPASGALTGAELIPMVQGGVNKQAALSDMNFYFGDGAVTGVRTVAVDHAIRFSKNNEVLLDIEPGAPGTALINLHAGSFGVGGYSNLDIEDRVNGGRLHYYGQDAGGAHYIDNFIEVSAVPNSIYDQSNGIVAFTNSGSKKLYLDYQNKIYQLGDIDGVDNSNKFSVDDTNNGIFVQKGAQTFFQIATAALTFQLGDLSGAGNNTKFAIIDSRGGYNFNLVAQYPNNAAALVGGLLAGDIYRITGTDHVGIVH